MKEIDARGLSCPQPVMMLKKALDSNPETCIIIVDNPIASENVSRYGKHAGYQKSVEIKENDFFLTFRKEG